MSIQDMRWLTEKFVQEMKAYDCIAINLVSFEDEHAYTEFIESPQVVEVSDNYILWGGVESASYDEVMIPRLTRYEITGRCENMTAYHVEVDDCGADEELDFSRLYIEFIGFKH